LAVAKTADKLVAAMKEVETCKAGVEARRLT
jgi:hypothetical protein